MFTGRVSILILAVLMLSGSADGDQEAPVRVAPRDPNAAPPSRVTAAELALGSCRAADGAIDLRRLMILENRWLDVEGGDGTFRLIIEGEQLLIERIGDPSHGALVHEIAYRVSPSEDIDIQLRLAMLEGGLALYWRETYQHQLYRQGLFRIVGEELEFLCEGEGGTWRSH